MSQMVWLMAFTRIDPRHQYKAPQKNPQMKAAPTRVRLREAVWTRV